MVDHGRVFRPRHDHASGVAQALQRVQGHDPVRRVEPVRVSVALDVVLPLRERGLEPVPGLEGVACLGQHAIPHLAIRRMVVPVPPVRTGSGQDGRASWRAEGLDHPAQVPQPGRDQREDGVRVRERRVGAPGRDAVADLRRHPCSVHGPVQLHGRARHALGPELAVGRPAVPAAAGEPQAALRGLWLLHPGN